MTPQELEPIWTPFLKEGFLGIGMVFFGFVAWFFYMTRERDRKEHKLEIAAKDAQIAELNEKRIREKDAIATLALSSEKSIEGLTRALNTRALV